MKPHFPFLRRALTRPVLLVAAGCVGALVTLDAAGPSHFRPVAARSLLRGFAAEPLAADALRPGERAFLAKAQESARRQMRLAEIGAGRAQAAEVRSHALQLAADYHELDGTLEALVRRKGGLPGAPVGDTSEPYAGLLTKSGADFDREFVRVVAQASNDVMTLFENAAGDARDADVRDLAASELPVLRAHRNAVANLKKALD